MKKIYLLLISALCALNAFAQLTGADEIPNIVIHERPLDTEHKMMNGTNFRVYGPTITSGTAKFFGLTMGYDGSDYRWANLRFALYNMNKEIVELYKPMRVYLWPNGINGFAIPCQVNAPAGDYYVVPMFRFDEDPENEWTAVYYSIFHPDNDLIDGRFQKLWKFSVIDQKLPLVKGFFLYDNDGRDIWSGEVNQGQTFKVTTRIRNPFSTTISGRIRIMHERNKNKFFPGYTYSDTDPAEEFCYAMTNSATWSGVKAKKDGSFDIQWYPNETKFIEFEDVVSYVNHKVYDQFLGELYFSFLPDGKEDIEENWIMLQEDCSTLFNGGELIYKEESQEYWDNVTYLKANTRNYRIFAIIPTSTSTESITSNGIQFDYINGQAIVAGLQPGQEVSIMSISGKMITRKVSESDNVSISLAGVPTGVYVATITDNGRVIASYKFVK